MPRIFTVKTTVLIFLIAFNPEALCVDPSIVYPIGRVFDIITQKERWILFCQEKHTSAMLLWDEELHRVSRLTSARFNPVCIKISPSADTIAFIDTGVLWIRRVWQRHTRALSPEYPIGTVVDCCWIDDRSMIVCAANNHLYSLYCVDVDQETAYRLQGVPTGNVLFPDTCNNALVYILRTDDEDVLYVTSIIQNQEGDYFTQSHKKLFSAKDMLLAFPRMRSNGIISFLGINKQILKSNQSDFVEYTLFLCQESASQSPVIQVLDKVSIEKSLALSCSKGRVEFLEGMLPILPYYNIFKNTLLLPRLIKAYDQKWQSELIEYDVSSCQKKTRAWADGISFLGMSWCNDNYIYGGSIGHGDNSQEACQVRYFDDEMLLTLGLVSC